MARWGEGGSTGNTAATIFFKIALPVGHSYQ